MRGISIISFLLISLIIHEATARSIQQYDNSYKELFSQFKVARELRGLKGKRAPPPPDPNKASHMLVPPAYRHRSPPPPSPSEVPTSYS
ncbi:hypothetical protein MTR67_016768 [Solanum verrucosum]|uniref:Uncharacterized protein n=1 Tax=Solanum verrucosum TaxID=315347 RepID=A0AAF0QHT9_SOLVR|nr:hypothetical protein MTR67_016768 [Solanum verrucosum]